MKPFEAFIVYLRKHGDADSDWYMLRGTVVSVNLSKSGPHSATVRYEIPTEQPLLPEYDADMQQSTRAANALCASIIVGNVFPPEGLDVGNDTRMVSVPPQDLKFPRDRTVALSQNELSEMKRTLNVNDTIVAYQRVGNSDSDWDVRRLRVTACSAGMGYSVHDEDKRDESVESFPKDDNTEIGALTWISHPESLRSRDSTCTWKIHYPERHTVVQHISYESVCHKKAWSRNRS